MSLEQLKADVITSRDGVLVLARAALDEGERLAYRSLTDVAEKLTGTANMLSPALSRTAVSGKPSNIPIFASPRNHGLVTAELSLARIQDGHRTCIKLGDEWMTASRAASSIRGTNVNGWRDFWRYHRRDGSVGPIDELRGI